MAGGKYPERRFRRLVGDIRKSPPQDRTALGIIALFTALSLLAPGCVQRQGSAAESTAATESGAGEHPGGLNVVLITIDTLRADRLSCYGSAHVRTPNMDRLASEGVLFNNAVSTVPFTLPAHASIMTGLYPPGHGVRENVGYSLDEDVPTLAEVLHDRGWATAGFVSAFVLDRRWGLDRGFEYFFDDFDITTTELPDLNAVQRTGDVTIAETVAWLDERPTNRPFFIWLHLYDPHDPYEPPEPYRTAFKNHLYDGEVAFTDSLIGEFRQALEDRDVLDDTLVVLTADHGEGLGDHEEPFHGFFLYDTTIHVPLIMTMPADGVAGRVVDTAVSHVDLLPTILDLVGVEIPFSVHGQSLTSFIHGDDVPDRAVYAESLYPFFHYGFAPLRALRTNNLKLIDAPRPELYETSTDRLEKNDVGGQKPAERAGLQRRLHLLREAIEPDRPVAAKVVLDQELAAQLEALGYVAARAGVTLDEEGADVRTDPKDTIGVHRSIMRARSRMKTDGRAAREILVAVLEDHPQVFDAHLLLGQIAATERRFEEAVVRFEKAVELNPDHRESLIGLAGAYRFVGRNDDALQSLHHLLRVAGSSTDASVLIADIEVERGRVNEAAVVLEKAVKGADSPSIVLNKLGEIRVKQGRIAEAVDLFRLSVSEDVTFADPNFNLATLLEDQGDVRAAVAHYERAIDLRPDYLEALFNLGRLMGRLGEADQQQSLWERAVESHPDFVRGRYYLAKLMLERGRDLTRAEVLVREGILRDPTHRAGALGFYLLAEILHRLGRDAEAEKTLAEGRRIQADAI